MSARVDQQKYRSSCIQQRNMLALKTGPSSRRPGTQFMAPAKVIAGGNYAARMEDFQFEVNTTFALEWGNQYVRFYSNGAQVVLSTAPNWVTGTIYLPGAFVTSTLNGLIYYSQFGIGLGTIDPSLDIAHWVQQSIYEVPTPYSALIGQPGPGSVAQAQVFQLKFCAINDVIYINHPDYPRGKLTRFADTNWVYQVVEDLTPALLDQNATDTTIAASSATGTTNLTASAPAWQSGVYYDVGDSVLWTDNNIYECEFPHTSGVFLTDLANGDWVETPIFLVGHVGSFWEISNLRNSAYIEYDGTAASGFAAGISGTITAFGSWEVHTYGVWSADVQIQSSDNGGITWYTVRTVSGRNDRNVDITGTALIAQIYRIVIENVAVPVVPGDTNPRVVFECVDAFLSGIVEITGVTDAYHATATVVTQLTVADDWISLFAYSANDRVGYNGVNYIALNAVTSSTAPPSDPTNWSADGWPSVYWSEAAWSRVRGFPTAITAYEQRVICGGTAFQPQRIWGTQQDDLENWDLGDSTLATDGFAFDLDAVGDGGVLWLAGQDVLFCGLNNSEWVISPSDGTTSISPTNVSAHRQSRWGSNPYISAIVVGDALIFVQRQGFSVRQMLFSVVTNKYMSQDLTALSDQVFNGGALQLAYQKQGQKNGFLWATTFNGEMVAMTYELDQEIFGWHRHFTGMTNGFPTDSGFESVCVIQGQGANDDEIWVVVNRFINGASVRLVERVNPVNWQTVIPNPGGTPGYSADKNQAYHVDCGATFFNTLQNQFFLPWLNGRTVVGVVNGLALPPIVANNGFADYSAYFQGAADQYVHIGLPFTSTLQPQNLDVDVHTGQTQGIVKRIKGVNLALLNTLGCSVTDGEGFNFDLNFRTLSTAMQNLLSEIPLFSDWTYVPFGGAAGRDIPVIIYTSGPLPLTVLALAPAYNISGKP